MTKRQLVPTALRAELTEYTSLIRALRANDTLDIASQITRYQQKGKARALDEDEDRDEDGDGDEDEVDMEDEEDDGMDISYGNPDDDEEEEELVAGPSNRMKQYQSSQPILPSPRPSSLKRKSTQSSPTSISSQPRLKRSKTDSNKSSARNTRDTWTRWPLLLEDVPVPEWRLEDEVGLIAEMLIKQAAHKHQKSVSTADSSFSGLRPRLTTDSRSSEPPPTSNSSSDTEMDDNPSDSDSELDLGADSAFISSLTLSTSSYLQFILASVSATLPKRAPSMQNRLAPVDWECVLEALVACSRVDGSSSSTSVSEKVLNNVRRRMQAISGLSSASGQVTQTAPVSSPRLIARPLTVNQQEDDSEINGSQQPQLKETGPIPELFSQPSTDSSSLISHRLQRLLASKQKLSETLARYGASEEAILSFPPAVPLPDDLKDSKGRVLRPKRKRAPPTRRAPRRAKKKSNSGKVYKSAEYTEDSDENHEDVPASDANGTDDVDLPLAENGNDDAIRKIEESTDGDEYDPDADSSA